MSKVFRQRCPDFSYIIMIGQTRTYVRHSFRQPEATRKLFEFSLVFIDMLVSVVLFMLSTVTE